MTWAEVKKRKVLAAAEDILIAIGLGLNLQIDGKTGIIGTEEHICDT
jgi:hypothetical protein